jgi:hypothetical protein
MKEDFNSQLKPRVAFAGFVIWTTLLGIAIWVNGGIGSLESPIALALAALATIGSAVFLLLIVFSSRVRAFALRPGANLGAVRKDLWFTIFLMVIVGAATFYSLVSVLLDA